MIFLPQKFLLNFPMLETKYCKNFKNLWNMNIAHSDNNNDNNNDDDNNNNNHNNNYNINSNNNNNNNNYYYYYYYNDNNNKSQCEAEFLARRKLTTEKRFSSDLLKRLDFTIWLALLPGCYLRMTECASSRFILVRLTYYLLN